MVLLCLFFFLRFHLETVGLGNYAKYFSYRGSPRGETDSPFGGRFTFSKYPPDTCFLLLMLGIDFVLWRLLSFGDSAAGERVVGGGAVWGGGTASSSGRGASSRRSRPIQHDEDDDVVEKAPSYYREYQGHHGAGNKATGDRRSNLMNIPLVDHDSPPGAGSLGYYSPEEQRSEEGFYSAGEMEEGGVGPSVAVDGRVVVGGVGGAGQTGRLLCLWCFSFGGRVQEMNRTSVGMIRIVWHDQNYLSHMLYVQVNSMFVVL